MKEASDLKQDIVFQATLRGHVFDFHSTWGLFSPRAIDAGSRMLLEELQLEPHHDSLDLGCGYGAIGLPIARCCPQGQVHMVDKDTVALEYAEKNARRNGLANCRVYQSNALGRVPRLPFDNVVANLPAHVGRELLCIILGDAWDRLRPGGRIYVVTIAHIRRFVRRNLLEVFGNYSKLAHGRAYTVAMAERAPGRGQRRPAPPLPDAPL